MPNKNQSQSLFLFWKINPFWRSLIEEILQQDDKGMEPQDMKLNPEGNYVIQHLNPTCHGCGKTFKLWSAKMQHIGTPKYDECATEGANNIEKKLSNEIYVAANSIPYVRKRNGRLYAVLETLIGMRKEAYIPPAQAFNLAVPLPPSRLLCQCQLEPTTCP